MGAGQIRFSAASLVLQVNLESFAEAVRWLKALTASVVVRPRPASDRTSPDGGRLSLSVDQLFVSFEPHASDSHLARIELSAGQVHGREDERGLVLPDKGVFGQEAVIGLRS